MKQRKVISVFLCGVMMVSLCACGSTGQRKTFGSMSEAVGKTNSEGNVETIKMVVASNQTSADNPYHFGLETFKEVLEELSKGSIQVECSDGTISEDEAELVSKLDAGEVQMIVCSPGHMSAVGVSEVNMLSLLYLFDDFSHWEAAMDGEFGSAINAVILEKTKNKYRIMGYWSAGVRDYYGKKPITTAKDVEGMTIRTQTSSVVGQFWTTIGAQPVTVGWGDLYDALKNNEVDSAENDYTNLMLKEHHTTENGKYICETHHDYTTRLFIMNGDYYDRLTAEQKKWVDTAALAATLQERTVTYAMMDGSKEQCIRDGAVVTPYEKMDIESFKNVAIEIQNTYAAEQNLTSYLEMVRRAN